MPARSPSRRFPLYGIAGLCLLLGTLTVSIYDHYNPGVSSAAHHVASLTTALCWWGYLLFVDGWIHRLKGGSLLTTRRGELAVQIPLSVILWIVFEIYNFHMRNWHYEGISVHRMPRMIGAVAAFATVLPGVLSTAEWLDAVGFCRRLRAPVIKGSSKAAYTCIFLGLFCLTFPLMMPREVAKYLFALVWMGFVFLLDPLNHANGAPSLFGDLAKGELRRSACLFTAGILCGFWWESWNYLAATKWVYDAPFTPGLSIFEMPLAGFIGFGPFAWELFAMYHFARVILGIEESGDSPSPGSREVIGAPRPIRHPITAALYDRLTAGAETGVFREHREALAEGLKGSVLDLGVGTGAMFPYLDASGAAALHGVEPDPHMLRRAARKASEFGAPIRLCQASAERLPFADGSLDVVVSALVLCTVRDVPQALAEVSRVLRPGGEFRFYEHVRSDGAFGRFQDVGAPLWKRAAAGCNLNRRTEWSIRDGPLELVSTETFETSMFPVRTFIRGVAVRPS